MKTATIKTVENMRQSFFNSKKQEVEEKYEMVAANSLIFGYTLDYSKQEYLENEAGRFILQKLIEGHYKCYAAYATESEPLNILYLFADKESNIFWILQTDITHGRYNSYVCIGFCLDGLKKLDGKNIRKIYRKEKSRSRERAVQTTGTVKSNMPNIQMI